MDALYGGYFSGFGPKHDGNPYGGISLGPRSVVVAHVLEPEKVGQREPGVSGTLADAAVGDDVVAVLQAGSLAVEGVELGKGPVGPVVCDRLAPGNVVRGRDVATTKRR